MRDDFACFIFSHGRADKVLTLPLLRKCGYTGKIYIVCDDEDDQIDEYRKLDCDGVLVFCKTDYMEWVDSVDNFQEHRALLYGRNAGFDLARDLGLKYYVQLDDDYTQFDFRYRDEVKKSLPAKAVTCLDDVFDAYIEFLEESGAMAIAMAQGGDFIGGYSNTMIGDLKRKCMNTWFCKTDRRIYFLGTMNDDVNTYILRGNTGELYFTDSHLCVIPKQTQAVAGGMTEIYLDQGTYVKSFYSVVVMPSAARISAMGASHYRIHHEINWNNCVPCILSEGFKK